MFAFGGFIMKKQLRCIFLLLILAVLSTTELIAQTAFGSEAELKAQAAKLFDDDEFEEAYPLYAQLASLYNKDANYNFRLGVCMLYASEDKEKPIPFLEFAAKNPDVDKEVFFYLAKAYHLNYRFDEAIQQYYAYQKIASGQKAEKLQVGRQIEMCKNGKKLLRNVTDLLVIDKKEMSRSDFFRSYDLSDIGGKLLAKPDEDVFKTQIDRKKKETSIIYFSSDNNQIYFSSYGDDLTHGKDIYLIRKLPNGELSKPQTLGYPVNTEYDEDFPFLHPNGKVLYFCSKGHNSMGGYDIFKTTLNELTNTWNKPVNLDFPINSPDDDILYITNANEREAFFSSARSSATGKTAVYHINVERKPIDVVIVNGLVVKSNPEQDLNLKITVKDLNDNVILGIFNSKPETGDYTMNLPSGGKVMYTIEAPGLPTQSEVVTLPSQIASNAVKQEISFDPQTGKLNIKNSFDEVPDDNNYKSVLGLIREKAKMEVNITDYNADNVSKNGTVDDSTATKAKPVKNKPSNLSNADIIKIAYADAKDVETEAKALKAQADFALVTANQKNEEGQNKTREIAQLTAEANQSTDNNRKQSLQEQASQADKALADINQETVATFNIAKALELKANAKQKEADLSLQYAKDLEAAVKSKSSKEALAKLDEQQKNLEAVSQKNDESANISTGLKLDAENKKKELDKAVQNAADIRQEITDTETAIATTEADAAKEKNDQIKQGMQDQIAGLKVDVVESKKELERNEVKINQLQKEYNGINNQIELVNNLVDKAKTEGNETAAASAATVDKTKLEEQVNNLKKSDKTFASAQPVSTKENKTDIKETNDKTPVVIKSTEKTTVENKQVENEAVNKQGSTSSDSTVHTETKQPVETVTTEPASNAIKKINENYERQLLAVDNLKNEAEKEKAKGELFERWAGEIAADIRTKQQALIAAPTFKDKEILAKQIEEQERLKTEKKELAEKSKTRADAFKQTETGVAVNVPATSDTTKAETVKETAEKEPVEKEPVEKETELEQLKENEQEYVRSINNAELETTELEKENKKLKAASTFINTVTLVIDIKKAALKSEQDPIKQKQITNQLERLEAALNEKKKLADDAQLKINQLAGVSDAEKTTETTPAVATPDAGTLPTPVAKKEEPAKPFEYENASAKNNLDKASALYKEAEDNLTEVNQLKEQAGLQSDINEKNALYTRADELTTIAETKKIEAFRLTGLANITEYKNNQHAVDQYVNASTGKSSDELSIAELMKDEAKIYFDKAQNSRKAAATFSTYYAKQTALEDASKNELIALEKQSKALAIYKRKYPELVIKPLIVTDVVALTPVKEKNTNTNESAGNDTSNTTVAKNNPVVSDTLVSPESTPITTQNTAANKNIKVAADEKNEPLETTTEKEKKTEVKTSDQSIVKKETDVESARSEETEMNKNEQAVATKAKPVDVTKPVVVPPKPKNSFLSPGEMFEKNGLPKYSATNRIPIDEKLPDGLIFKVQLGAFRNSIPQNLFKGISPISGETTQNGFIRYTAGLFLKCETVENAKNEIKQLGYKDAFVVAFFNGKRIPLPCGGSDEAVALLLSKKSGTSVKTTGTSGNEDEAAMNAVANTTDLTTLSGLFYTIQVGVYSNPVAASKLFNIQPLYSQKTTNIIRYTVGIYNTIPLALEAKKIAMSGGLTDAFMTIYHNGKRISMAEATTLAAQGITFLSSAPGLNVLPSFGSELKGQQPSSTTIEKNQVEKNITTIPSADKTQSTQPKLPAPVKQSVAVTDETGIVFKVQIGAFNEEVPLDIANTFLKIAKKGIKNYKDEKGLTIYTVGKYKSYEEADKSKQEVVAEGVTGAFVVAYSDGKKISVEEAQKLLGK